MSETLTGTVKRMTDENNNVIFPVTSTSAVLDSNGDSLNTIIDNKIDNKITTKMDKANPEFTGTMVSGTTSSTPGVAGDFLNLSVNDGLIIKDSGYYSQIKKGQIYVNNASAYNTIITPSAIKLSQHDANAKLEVTADNDSIVSTVKANEIKSGGDVKSTDSSGNTVSLNELNSSISGINESLADITSITDRMSNGFYFDGSEYSDLHTAIQACVDSLPNDSKIHMCTVKKGGIYVAIIQKYSSSSYASALVYGYGGAIYLEYKSAGNWKYKTVTLS